MKAIDGHTYAQINDTIVNWIFTGADLSEWADASDVPQAEYHLTTVDITGVIPAPSAGWTYKDGVFSPPDLTPTFADLDNGVTLSLNQGAQSWGYDSIVAGCSYIGSTNPQFKADAQALTNWRDATWTFSNAYKDEIRHGLKPTPASVAAYIALLPAQPVKPVV